MDQNLIITPNTGNGGEQIEIGSAHPRLSLLFLVILK